MTGNLKRSTANFNLGIPFFDAPGWGQAYERAMDIIDAVLGTTGAISNIVGDWQNNTTYGVGNRVVDTVDNKVYQAAVAHTSGLTTFLADRTAHPTYWTLVTPSVIVRGQFVTGTQYYIGDFIYDTAQSLSGIVLSNFTGGANLRTNIANLGVIVDMLSSPTINTPVLTLKQSATPTPTAEGQLEWDTDDNSIKVGDGVGTKEFVDVTKLVLKAGDTMTGDLTISKATPSLLLNKAVSGDATVIRGQTAGLTRWRLDIGNSVAESGSNAGSDFALVSYTDAGAANSTVLSIARSTGLVSTSGGMVVGGGQIKFPATQNPSSDANTLDDYEESTFTPTLGFSSGSGTTYSSQLGRYIKIGKLVQFTIDITITSKGTGTGPTSIAGLPFTNVAQNTSANVSFVSGITFTKSISAAVAAGSNVMTLYADQVGGLDAANVANASRIIISGAYEATT